MSYLQIFKYFKCFLHLQLTQIDLQITPYLLLTQINLQITPYLLLYGSKSTMDKITLRPPSVSVVIAITFILHTHVCIYII